MFAEDSPKHGSRENAASLTTHVLLEDSEGQKAKALQPADTDFAVLNSNFEVSILKYSTMLTP